MERRLAAIFFADLVGYSSRMEEDEPGTYALIKSVQTTVFEPQIAAFDGRIVKLMGDCVMAEFHSVLGAVHCALSIQRILAKRSLEARDGAEFAYRIGINLGDIILDDEDVYGDMVNIASRVEALAGPGEVWVTRPVRDQIRDRIETALDDRGCIQVKNISRPVRVFRLLDEPEARPVPSAPRRRAGGRLALGAAALTGCLIVEGLSVRDAAPPPLSTSQVAGIEPRNGRYVTRVRTNLRLGPGTEHDVARTVAPGTPFEMTGLIDGGDGEWLQVRSSESDGEYFVFANLLSPAPERTDPEPATDPFAILDDLLEPLEIPADEVALRPAAENPPVEPGISGADRIWFRVVIDTAGGSWQDCIVYGHGSVHSIVPSPDGSWTPVDLADLPGIDLRVRARARTGGAVVDVWPFSREWPESRALSIPLASTEPGSSGRAFSKGRALRPLEFCGRFSVFVDVVDEPEEG